MQGINDRIRIVRKDKGLTQKEFGEKIGMKANSISDLESGKNAVSNLVIRGICREFNVNLAWLQTGEGEMYGPSDMEYYIHVGRLAAASHPIKRILVDFIDALPDEYLDRLYENFKKYEKDFLKKEEE